MFLYLSLIETEEDKIKFYSMPFLNYNKLYTYYNIKSYMVLILLYIG